MKMNNKKLLLIGGGVVLALLIVVGIALAFNNPPKEPAVIEEPAAPTTPIIEEAPKPVEPEVIVYPLTGLEAEDKSLTLKRPLSVKIENSPEARPQMGFGSADVVYETITESGISRMNCIFQSTIPDEVGPVRSGRNSDVTLVPQYDALFFMSGANDIVLSEIAAAGLANMSHTKASDIYYRVDYRYAPHNLYLHLSGAYSLAEQLGLAVTVDPVRSLEFGENKGASTSTATNVSVPFSDYYIADWSWNDSEKVYLRSMNGPTMDSATDKQISAANVVVLWTTYTPVLGGPTMAVNMNSGGEASLFANGQRIDGTWESDGSNPPRFKDTSGNSIKLTPGKTWFQVLNIGQSISAS